LNVAKHERFSGTGLRIAAADKEKLFQEPVQEFLPGDAGKLDVLGNRRGACG
jgi:hypothetical protein